MDYFNSLLNLAALTVAAAADACRVWEDGGDPDIVTDTAWEADEATTEAVTALASIDAAVGLDTYPETRLGRLVMASRTLVLADTDEGGQSQDLKLVGQLLTLAASV